MAKGREEQDHLPFGSIMLVPRTTIAGGMEALPVVIELCVLTWLEKMKCSE